MAGATNYLENALANHVFRNTTFTSPASTFLSLHVSDPGEAGSGGEVSGGAYARIEMLAADWNAPSDGLIDNVNAEEWAQATAQWGTLSHFGSNDALTGGNMLVKGAFNTPKLIDTDDTARIQANDLSISFA